MTQRSFPILMLHALAPPLEAEAERESLWAQDPQLRDPGARLYALDRRTFESQVSRLAGRGVWTARSWADLDPPARPNQLWLTFDDGHQSNFLLALPVLEHYGLVAIFFITTDWIGRAGFMDEDQIRALRRAGQLIGAHGASHRYLSDLPEGEIRRELEASKARLEAILGEPVPAMSLPGGRGGRRVREMAAQAGYKHLFTSTIAMADPAGDPLAWPRIPMTNRLPEDFLEKILNGDPGPLRVMARRARLRRAAAGLLGNHLYDRVRGWILRGR